ncbi:hypothetical protein F511_28958 [Dorcoceras hygrometricum]|uniref:Uncharacterized protein n=1 Tax=Dorcoceras hygrometricum TaxID=472368 RepID=A0A2Z7C4V3_9LAMI|nr:hypothetical protein F511_28958 [Dorcoceras hygrometricum]
MGCPGQARTKPEGKISRRIATGETPDGGRTAAAAANKSHGSSRTHAASSVASPRHARRTAARQPRCTPVGCCASPRNVCARLAASGRPLFSIFVAQPSASSALVIARVAAAELTREDLVTALNDMVQEYKNLSQSFEEVKAERESCATKSELEGSSEMQTALSKMSTENEQLRSRSEEMLNENQCLVGRMSSWTRSSASMDKLHGAMKSSRDKI